jgi:methyl coenzyme M reductase beta subunit
MINDNVDSYAKLTDELLKNSNLATIRMMTLRKVHGAERLGANVVSGIQDSLSEHGIGHEPAELPNNQHAIILIYRNGTTIDKIIKHIRDIKENTDTQIVNLIGDDDVRQKIKKIKELICE